MKSIASRLASFAAVSLTLFSLSGTARADVPPPDACSNSASVGSSCSNAGDNYDEPGTCQNSTCPHSTPLQDGGVATASEPCVVCQAGATTTRPDSGTGSSSSSSSSGCSATPDARDGATGFAMLVLGAIGLVLSRRKKSA